MAGTCNSVRCLPTSALSRAEVTGDFRGSLMRRSSKVRSTRRRDCGDYQAAAWTTCSAAELNRRPRYQRAMLALWLMTALGQSRRFDRAPLTSGLPRLPDIFRVRRHVSKVPMNETARAVGRCGMAVPAIDGTMRASYLMMMRGQKQIVQHDDLAISSTALGAHRT